MDRSSDGYAVRIDPSKGMPPERAYALGIAHVTDDLLEAVLSRGVAECVNERFINLNEKNELKRYFYLMVKGMSMKPQMLYEIVVSILVGLAKGPPFINKRINPVGGDPMPMLMYACQWKLLKKNTQNLFIAQDELR